MCRRGAVFGMDAGPGPSWFSNLVYFVFFVVDPFFVFRAAWNEFASGA
jgi:hypothetical protein